MFEYEIKTWFDVNQKHFIHSLRFLRWLQSVTQDADTTLKSCNILQWDEEGGIVVVVVVVVASGQSHQSYLKVNNRLQTRHTFIVSDQWCDQII